MEEKGNDEVFKVDNNPGSECCEPSTGCCGSPATGRSRFCTVIFLIVIAAAAAVGFYALMEG